MTVFSRWKRYIACFIAVSVILCIPDAGAKSPHGIRQIKKQTPFTAPKRASSKYHIGAFYMPGWQSGSNFWNDLKGTPDSKSPGRQWTDRMPLLGVYPEEEEWVADWHIKWAVEHGISFFVYDWFWLKKGRTHLEHALKAHNRSQYKDLLKFCIMWANHEPFIPDSNDVSKVTSYWIQNYFNQSNYLKIDGKPVVMVFLPYRIGGDQNNTNRAVSIMRNMVKKAGYKDIILVAIANNKPDSNLSRSLRSAGYNAYTPYNYIDHDVKNASYDNLIEIYKTNWRYAEQAEGLPYIVPVTPGWDNRPWFGEKGTLRTGSSPDKFKSMLKSAKAFLDASAGKKNIYPDVVLVEAWNEFAEGAYIEPASQWKFGYLDSIREVFTDTLPEHIDEYPEGE